MSHRDTQEGLSKRKFIGCFGPEFGRGTHTRLRTTQQYRRTYNIPCSSLLLLIGLRSLYSFFSPLISHNEFQTLKRKNLLFLLFQLNSSTSRRDVKEFLGVYFADQNFASFRALKNVQKKAKKELIIFATFGAFFY